MSSVYRPLFRRAWSITRQEKRLWLFGLFTAIVVGGGEVDVFVRNLDRLQALGVWAEDVRAGGISSLPLSVVGIMGLPSGFFAVAAIFLALVIFLLWFAIVSEGALVWGIERVRRRADISIEEGIRQGKKLWGRTAAITLGFYIGVNLAWVLFALPPFLLFLGLGSSVWFTTFLIVAFLCLIPAGFILVLLFRLSLAAAVVEQEPALHAFGIAWHLFCTHWLVLLETVVMLTAGTTLAAIIALSAAVAGLILLFSPLLLLSFVVGAPVVLGVVMGLAVLLFFLALFVVGAVLATFQQAVWVLLFVRLRESPPLAKLVRLIASRGRLIGRAGA